VINSFNIRGEIAWRNINDNYKDNPEIPNPDLQLILGLDRTFDKFNIIVQYLTRYTFDFSELPVIPGMPSGGIGDSGELPPLPPEFLEPFFRYQLEKFNRAIFYQSRPCNHSVSFRPSLRLFYETLEIEVFSMYNFSIEEFSIFPGISYQVSDGLKVRAGYQYYYGAEDTNFDLIAPVLNSGFFEIRYTF
jgi:hypothetical protein